MCVVQLCDFTRFTRRSSLTFYCQATFGFVRNLSYTVGRQIVYGESESSPKYIKYNYIYLTSLAGSGFQGVEPSQSK